MATKRSAPQQGKASSNNSISYSPASRTDHQVPVLSKGQPSGGGLNGIDGSNPEVGTSDAP